MSVNEKNEKTAYLVWCAMIALRLARQEGRVSLSSRRTCFLSAGSPTQSGSAAFPATCPPIYAGCSSRDGRSGFARSWPESSITSGVPPPAILWSRLNSSASPGVWKQPKVSSGCIMYLAIQNGSGCVGRVLTQISAPCISPNLHWKRCFQKRGNRARLFRSESPGTRKLLAYCLLPVAGRFSLLRNLMSCFCR